VVGTVHTVVTKQSIGPGISTARSDGEHGPVRMEQDGLNDSGEGSAQLEPSDSESGDDEAHDGSFSGVATSTTGPPSSGTIFAPAKATLASAAGSGPEPDRDGAGHPRDSDSDSNPDARAPAGSRPAADSELSPAHSSFPEAQKQSTSKSGSANSAARFKFKFEFVIGLELGIEQGVGLAAPKPALGGAVASVGSREMGS